MGCAFYKQVRFIKCLRCNEEWKARSNSPKQCKNHHCKNPFHKTGEFEWITKSVFHYRCLRCTGEWIPQRDVIPKTCGRCNATFWYKPKERLVFKQKCTNWKGILKKKRYTPKEMSELLDIDIRNVYKHISRGNVKMEKKGQKDIIKRRDLLKFLES